MRYTLRNKNKIEDAYDKSILKRIDKSLKVHFGRNKEIELHQVGDDKYKTLIVDDAGHSFNIISFYVIKKKYDVYTLAFNEFIG